MCDVRESKILDFRVFYKIANIYYYKNLPHLWYSITPVHVRY